MKTFSFNLNHYIKVKLKEKGYQLLADDHNQFIGQITNWHFRTADYYKSRADENGYTRFQAHDFINKFAHTIYITSLAEHFDLNILIDEKELEMITNNETVS